MNDYIIQVSDTESSLYRQLWPALESKTQFCLDFQLVENQGQFNVYLQTTKSFFKHFPESEDQTIRMVPANLAVHAVYENGYGLC